VLEKWWKENHGVSMVMTPIASKYSNTSDCEMTYLNCNDRLSITNTNSATSISKESNCNYESSLLSLGHLASSLFDNNALFYPPTLTQLTLAACHLREMPRELYLACNLTVLDLEHNMISFIDYKLIGIVLLLFCWWLLLLLLLLLMMLLLSSSSSCNEKFIFTL
jgi:hypothetical protein